MRPLGRPPMPSAMSRLSEPVEIDSISTTSRSPRRISEPLPNALSIWEIAASRAFFLSTPSVSTNRNAPLLIACSLPNGPAPVNGGYVPLLFSFCKEVISLLLLTIPILFRRCSKSRATAYPAPPANPRRNELRRPSPAHGREDEAPRVEIGRASCRERVSISVVAVSLKKEYPS